MWYKPYGRTGKKISVVGFGGMRFDHPENIDANAELLLHAHRNKFLEAYNYRILGQGDGDISDRLRWHWGLSSEAAKACIECGQCEDKCTQHLPIIERLKYITGVQK